MVGDGKTNFEKEIDKTNKNFSSKIVKYLYFKIHPLIHSEEDYINNIVIFGSPRSGTSWLAQTLQSLEHSYLVWEPLNPAVDTKFKKLKFSLRQVIPENEKWPEAKYFFHNLFTGKGVNYYNSSLASLKSIINGKVRVIKFVRGNMLLPWIIKNFKIPTPIYIVRHPCAQIASALNRWGKDHITPNDFPYKSKFGDFYSIHKEELSKLKTKEELLAAWWCLENYQLLNSTDNNKKWITIYYEDLVLTPEKELEEIFSRLKIKMPEKILSKVKEQSMTAALRYKTEKGLPQISKWKSQLTDSEINRIMKVLDLFEIKVYGEDLLPIKP